MKVSQLLDLINYFPIFISRYFPADLVAFTEEMVNGKLHLLCSETGQYVSCNCFLTWPWRHKFLDYSYVSNEAIFLHGQKVKIKGIFPHFKGLPVAINCLRTGSGPFKPMVNPLSANFTKWSKCVWPFCRIDAERVKSSNFYIMA